MDEDQRTARLERLEPFVGEWRIEATGLPFPPELAGAARSTFEWTLGGAFLLQRSSIPVQGAPDGLCVIGPDAGDGYTQHYFDSRGVARIYAMTSSAATGPSNAMLRISPRSRSTSAGAGA